MRYITKEVLEGLDISTAEVVASMERLISAQAKGRAWIAPKTNLSTSDGRFMMATLAAADEPPFMAVKALLINPANPERGLSTINSSITLLDSRSGLPVAVMDGNWVTGFRTAAASVMLAKRLANPDASVLALVGCGTQARCHLKAFAETFPLREVRAFGRGESSRSSLCRMATGLGLTALASDSAEQALSDADLVVSSIPLLPKVEPFLDGGWLKPGVFISSTDLALPWKPEGMKVFDRIIIDDRIQEAAMAEPMLDAGLVSGDIAELLCGKVKGRQTRDERNAFVFRSVAVGDLALAALAYGKLRDQDVEISA